MALPLDSAVMRSENSSRQTARARPGGVRARTLAAARELFSKNGYQATTTKEISIKAGIAEPTLFRHFGSKAELFETTILEPFTAFISAWTSSWEQMPADDPLPELAETLLGGLFKLVHEDRRLFRELIAARADPQSDLHQPAVSISAQVRQGLRAVHDAGLDIAAARGLRDLDPPATIASVTSMVIGSVLLEDWVVPGGLRKPSQARMITEMTKLVTDGIAHRR
jgi:AcrR family transcriptional regulator